MKIMNPLFCAENKLGFQPERFITLNSDDITRVYYLLSKVQSYGDGAGVVTGALVVGGGVVAASVW